MKRLIYILLVFCLSFFIVGCKKDSVQIGNLDGYIKCMDEEILGKNCNLNYTPVCGDDGQTYGNVCVACSSQKINFYKSGECGCVDLNGICSVSDKIQNDIVDDELLSSEENIVQELIIDVPMPNFQ